MLAAVPGCAGAGRRLFVRSFVSSGALYRSRHKPKKQPRTMGDVAKAAPLPRPVVDTAPAEDAMPSGIVPKMKYMWARYGMLSIGLYASLYVGPGVLSFGLYTSFDNFGLDPMELVNKLGLESLVDRLFGSHAESPRYTSAVLALLTAEVLEPVRLPLTVFLCRKLARRKDAQM